MKHTSLTCVSLILLISGAIASADDSKKPGAVAADTPAAKILAMMAGFWDEEVEMADGKKVRGITKGRFVMDGNWLETESDIPINDKNRVLHLALWGWDEKAGVFKSWMFSPTGAPLESTATYDEKERTLTSSGKTGNGSSVDVVTRFISADRHEWTVEIKDKEGQKVASFKGVNTRRKE